MDSKKASWKMRVKYDDKDFPKKVMKLNEHHDELSEDGDSNRDLDYTLPDK